MDNAQIVREFWTQAFQQKDPAGAAAEHLGEQYIQHNPLAVDGAEGLVGFVGALQQQDPGFRAQLIRIVAEGDLVATHSRFDVGGATMSAMDFWRLEDGRIVEHWDAIQPVPAQSRNDHGMF
ncbi:nuclear transport factor 2 family protein [Agrococcus sp. SGAir0287]|uniref:nuclear transport factor 2 family protein n=1 Tax=Agrococcus sp. SGAir0287 TaxID=2070347 RepID=UPI0010CCB932|nr:nuclear transport factor 2 family protein [Agrococcus sp. SGAir0287]QCR20259.1 hypothetical protein C1N71_13105 [Agrococcus sp. SGAir0287]